VNPVPLRKGDAIAVVAASGPASRARVEKGIGVLLDGGHPVELGRSVFAKRGFLAGTDDARAADLDAAIRRDDLPGIFFARGGWGAARLLDRVDLARLRARPRVLLGYSDLTALFMALQKPGDPYPYRYGPVVSELGEPRSYEPRSLREALYLERPRIDHDFGRGRVLRPGSAQGVLVGGTLTLLNTLLGTRFDFSWDGCILFWEDLNEPPYRIDRMLQQLRLAGKLKNLAGMIVGKLAGCGAKPPTAGWPIREIVLEAAAGTSYPIVMDFPCGHIPRKRTLLMGVPADLRTSARSLTLRV